VLKYPDVREVALVELDPAVITIARTYPPLAALNGRALDDPRVTVVNEDAFTWARAGRPSYDAVIVDFPDPDEVATAKLYSVEFYGLAARLLAPGGRMVVQAGSPFFAPRSFWCIERSIREAGLRTVPYHVDVPSFGDWGYVLASASAPRLGMPPGAPATRFLDDEVLRAATVFARDLRRPGVEPNTLVKPVIVGYEDAEWRDF
jgi:spermidine synthase